MKKNIEVIHAPTDTEPFLIIYKYRNIKSAPLKEGEENCAVTSAISIFPEIKNVIGKKKCEYGLLHRLDTDACGLLLIATTQSAYDFFLSQQKENKFIKTYSILCNKNIDNANILGGFPVSPVELEVKKHLQFLVTSSFRSYKKGSKEVRPVTEKSSCIAKKKSCNSIYTTKIKIEDIFENNILTKCIITNGFRHQVRCHLAWIGLPVQGDALYNSKYNFEKLEFECTKLEFENPVTKEKFIARSET